ncbi:TPA: DUF1642 domain-containing protein [Streptococcus suis]
MNKQEAIEVIEQDKMRVDKLVETNSGAHSIQQKMKVVDYVPLEVVVNVINQIHEPQKVVVPKFVAEWIEYCKSNELTLLGAFDPVSEHGIGLANTFTGEVWKGVDWAKRNQETFARAWLFGYEIEQEQLYTVEIPNPNRSAYTVLQKQRDNIVLVVTPKNSGWRDWGVCQLTESEIKQDFEWAWDAGFAKEVE